MRKKKLYILTFCLLAMISNGQKKIVEDKRFYHLSKQNGMSHNNVTDVLLDKEGFYWIGTFNGLNRFDGTNFNKFYYDQNNLNSLSHNHITDIEEDNQGNIWVATMHGLNKFDKKTGKFTRFFFHSKKSKKITDELINRIYTIAKDNDGDIWFSAYGVRRIRPTDNSQLSFESTIPVKNNPVTFSFFGFDKKLNGIWIRTAKNLNFFDIENKQFYNLQNNPKKWLVFDEVFNAEYQIKTNNNGRVIITANSGELKVFEASSNKITNHKLPVKDKINDSYVINDSTIVVLFGNYDAIKYNFLKKTYSNCVLPSIFNYSTKSYFLPNKILGSKNLMYTSTEGIFIENYSDNPIVDFKINSRLNQSLHIFHILAQNNTIWLATNQGLINFNTITKKSKFIQLDQSTEDVTAVLALNDSVICIGTNSKIFFLNTRTLKVISSQKALGRIIFLEKSNTNKLWVGYWRFGLAEYDFKGKLLNHYTTNNGIRYNRLVACFKNQENGLWVGMNEGNGFFYIDFESRKITNYFVSEKSKNELNNNNINAIYQNNENEVWLGTYGGGVIIYNIKSDTYKKITQSNGLVSNYINCIKKDTNNNIWIASPDGVNYINPKDLEIRQTPLNFQYTDNDYTNNFTIAKNNTFYFSSNNSIHELNPNYFSEKRLTNKILLSSCLRVDKEAFYDIKNNNLELNYDQNFIKFTYSINKQNPIEQLQYAYFLQGIDKKWNYTNQSYCSYNNLPPGNYNFIIKATDKTGNWGTNQSLLKLKINPPFWQTWWFYLLSFIFTISLIYLFIQFRIHQVKKVVKIQNKMMNMQQKISEDLHDNIGASLSSINMMSEVIKQKSTNNNDSSLTNALDKISEISIEVIAEMKDTIWFINPKKQNFDFLIERIRQFTEPLCAELEIQFYLKYKSNNQLENLSLFEKKNIFLIIKEAINNALKYSKATKISLLISIVNNQLSILIKDDGIGIPENIPLGNGINNMKTRTEEMNGNITWKNQNGTLIEINIPIAKTKN